MLKFVTGRQLPLEEFSMVSAAVLDRRCIRLLMPIGTKWDDKTGASGSGLGCLCSLVVLDQFLVLTLHRTLAAHHKPDDLR